MDRTVNQKKYQRYKIFDLFFKHHGYLANHDKIFNDFIVDHIENSETILPNGQQQILQQIVASEELEKTHIVNKSDYNFRLGKYEIPKMTTGGYFIMNGIERVLLIQEHKSRCNIFTGYTVNNKGRGEAFTETRLRNARHVLKMLYSDNVYLRIVLEGGKSIKCINLLDFLHKLGDNIIVKMIEIIDKVFTRSKWNSAMITILSDITHKNDVDDDLYLYIEKNFIGDSTKNDVIYTLLYMLERCLSVMFDISNISDRDHCGNKVFYSPGILMKLLVGRATMDKKTGKLRDRIEKEVYSVIRTGIVTVYGKVETDMASTLGRRSVIDAISTVRRVAVPADVNSSISEMRQYHPSQKYFICPCETPEGKQVGLIRALAMTCVISPKMHDLYDLLKEKIHRSPSTNNAMMIIYNGIVIGFGNIHKFDELKKMKRTYPYMSININKTGDIDIRSYENRLMRPIIVNTNETFKWDDIDNYTTWKSLIDDGVIEYIDPFEADKIKDDDDDDDEKNGDDTTTTTNAPYLEIHDVAICGLPASNLPFLNHNPGARGTFAVSMIKQAIPAPQCDDVHETSYLAYPQKPLVSSYTPRSLDLPANGVNMTIAMMCWVGYGMEDAIIVNKGFVDRGGFMTITKEIKPIPQNIGSTTIVTVPGKTMKDGYVRDIDKDDGKKNIYVIDGDRTARKGTYYRQRYVMRESSTLTSCTVRMGSVGDKIASRSGQKGVIGCLIPAWDLPHDRDGNVPDIIINPHAIPSRMTMGHLMEIVLASICTEEGVFADSTAFSDKFSFHGNDKELSVTDIINRSKKNMTVMYDPYTGKKFPDLVNMGSIYYMIMPHKAEKKIYTRRTGPLNSLSHQPVSGKSNDGAPRMGEMELNALLSHGASHTLLKAIDESDREKVGVCPECGDFPIDICPRCDKRTKSSTTMSYATVVLGTVLKSMNIGMSIEKK